MFQFMLEILGSILFAIFMASQVISPIVRKTPIFPAFRNRDIDKEIYDLRLQYERRLMQLEKAKIRRDIRLVNKGEGK